jgi:FkbM family methyltransferase
MAKPDTTVFDVGANIGLMAIPLLTHVPECRVISFEPSENSVPYLRKTIEGSS